MDTENHNNHEELNQQNSSNQNNPEKSQNEESVKCLAELSMWQDQCKRISAEFENFKRRVDRDKIRWAEIANEGILLELLSFLDTFETALQHNNNVDNKGIEMVYQALLKLLAKHSVTVMPDAVDFDPEYHEAVMQVSSQNHQSGQVVTVLSKGFLMKDRVLRPAKVSVAV